MPDNFRIVPEKSFDFDTGKVLIHYWVEEYKVEYLLGFCM